MPQTGFLLPDGTSASFEDCLEGRADAGLPPPLIAAMVTQQRTNPHRGPLLSVTALIGCLRAVFLERTRDYVAAPIQNWYPHRGTVMHRAVENTMKGWLSEATFERAFGGRTVRGRIDAYEIASATLYDWKSVSETRLSSIMVYGIPREHVLQVNAYRLLMADRHPVRAMKLVYLGMNEIAVTGPAPMTVARGVRYLPEVETLPDDQVEDLLAHNAETLGRAFETGDPPPITDVETRRWKCGRFCPVRDQCVSFGDHPEFSTGERNDSIPIWAGAVYTGLKTGVSGQGVEHPEREIVAGVATSDSLKKRSETDVPWTTGAPVLPPPPPVPTAAPPKNAIDGAPAPWWPQA